MTYVFNALQELSGDSMPSTVFYPVSVTRRVTATLRVSLPHRDREGHSLP